MIPLEPDKVKSYLLSFVKGDELKKQVSEVLESVWDVFHKIPASSTGKYHPHENNITPYGLVNHTLKTAWLAEAMCYVEGVNDEERDRILAAAVLHDIGKIFFHLPHEGEDVDHGVKGAEIAYHYGLSGDIVDMIRNHMGRFEDKKLGSPGTRILAYADFMASRNYISIEMPLVKGG